MLSNGHNGFMPYLDSFSISGGNCNVVSMMCFNLMYQDLCSGGIQSTKFKFITKVHSMQIDTILQMTPPDAKPLLPVGLLHLSI